MHVYVFVNDLYHQVNDLIVTLPASMSEGNSFSSYTLFMID